MSISINIGNNDIKVIQTRGRKVVKWARLTSLSPELIRDGLVIKPEAVGNALSGLLNKSRFPRNGVVAGLAGLSFTYRFISLPRMKSTEMEEAILRAARKEISLPLEELYLTWQALPGKGDEITYFILGVPRNMVDAMVQTMREAGISSFLMDLRPLAIARAAARENAIIVNLESDCFDIVFVTGGIPRLIHTFSPRSDGATIEDNIGRLADELAKSVAFYQSNYPPEPLSPDTPLLLAGDLAVDYPAGEMIQNRVEYPVSNIVPRMEYPAEFPIASYTTSIGLVLKRTSLKHARRERLNYQDIDINILDGKFRRPKTRPVSIRSVLVGAAVVIAIVILFLILQARAHMSANIDELNDKLVKLSNQLSEANTTLAESNRIEESIRNIQADTAALLNANQAVLNARGNYSRDLRRITADLPPNTFFTSIIIEDSFITVEGETDNIFTVIEYANVLESEEIFREVRIVQLNEESIASDEGSDDQAPAEVLGIFTFNIFIRK